MADLDAFTIGVIAMVIAIAVIAFLEMKYLRKSMKSRRARAAKRFDEMPDDAHNAIVTAKAFLESMERGGARSEEVASLLRQAQVAYDRRNYRVVLDLTAQAKGRMLTLKAEQRAKGDLTKLDAMPSGAEAEEATTKERLTKDFPPNYAQARFTIDLAREAIEKERAAGRDVGPAQAWLVHAEAQFAAKDFNAALAAARHAQRGAEGGAVPPVPAAPVPAAPAPSAAAPVAMPACAACGAALAHDDVFCRKCGTKVAA